jgi:hypothetical protein
MLKLNSCSVFSSGSWGTLGFARGYLLAQTEEDSMKMFAYVIAALATIAIAAPSIASAETIVVKHRHHHDWHPFHHHHHDRMVIIKHGHHHDM